MGLMGEGFVILWHDITADADDVYNAWHTREHMPERISLPGFLRSRRGLNRALDRQQYFTLYEGETLESFVSPEYQRSLNYPTEWTQRVAPHFRNFQRMSCTLVHSSGKGLGGALATLRGSLPAGADEASFVRQLLPALEQVGAREAITGVHAGIARDGFSGGHTKEIDLRPAMNEIPFDVVVIVEAIGLAEMDRELDGIASELAQEGLAGLVAQSYDMAYMLSRLDA
jgi:hypothetical protein